MLIKEEEEVDIRREMEAELISEFYYLSDKLEICDPSFIESITNSMIKIYETLFPN